MSILRGNKQCSQTAEPEMPHQTAQPIPENSAVDADAAAALTKLLANPSMAKYIWIDRWLDRVFADEFFDRKYKLKKSL